MTRKNYKYEGSNPYTKEKFFPLLKFYHQEHTQIVNSYLLQLKLHNLCVKLQHDRRQRVQGPTLGGSSTH